MKYILKYQDVILKQNKYVLIGVPVVLVLLVIGCWLIFGGSSYGGIIHPSSTSRSYSNANTSSSNAADSGVINEYDYTEAPDHIGERATIRGTVVRTFTSKSGVTFFDFCQGFDACPFSAVIFASDVQKFGDLKGYERAIKLTGVIKSYQSNAEMILNDPDQIE